MKAILLIALTLFSVNSFAAGKCSRLTTCSGEKWTKIGEWSKTEAGTSIKVEKGQLCYGASYPSIGVEFADGVKFIADPKQPDLETVKAVLGDKLLVQGRFISRHGKTLATTEVPLNSKSLSTSVYVGNSFYQIACSTK